MRSIDERTINERKWNAKITIAKLTSHPSEFPALYETIGEIGLNRIWNQGCAGRVLAAIHSIRHAVDKRYHPYLDRQDTLRRSKGPCGDCPLNKSALEHYRNSEI